MPQRWRFRIELGIWTAVVAAATLPWTDFVGHTHWQKVQWIPFVSPPVRPLDIIGNVALYLPLGYSLIRSSSHKSVWRVAAIAGLLSFAIESSQLYSHARFPSVQDLCCNIFGAWVGASFALRRYARAHFRSQPFRIDRHISLIISCLTHLCGPTADRPMHHQMITLKRASKRFDRKSHEPLSIDQKTFEPSKRYNRRGSL
jgi:VanZ family protein